MKKGLLQAPKKRFIAGTISVALFLIVFVFQFYMSGLKGVNSQKLKLETISQLNLELVEAKKSNRIVRARLSNSWKNGDFNIKSNYQIISKASEQFKMELMHLGKDQLILRGSYKDFMSFLGKMEEKNASEIIDFLEIKPSKDRKGFVECIVKQISIE